MFQKRCAYVNYFLQLKNIFFPRKVGGLEIDVAIF